MPLFLGASPGTKSRRKVLVNCGTHGNEITGMLGALRAVRQLLGTEDTTEYPNMDNGLGTLGIEYVTPELCRAQGCQQKRCSPLAYVSAGEHYHARNKPDIILDHNGFGGAFRADAKFRSIKGRVVPASVHDLASRRDEAAVANGDPFLCVNAASVNAAILPDADLRTSPVGHQFNRSVPRIPSKEVVEAKQRNEIDGSIIVHEFSVDFDADVAGTLWSQAYAAMKAYDLDPEVPALLTEDGAEDDASLSARAEKRDKLLAALAASVDV